MKTRLSVLFLLGLIITAQSFSQSYETGPEVYLPEELVVVNNTGTIHTAEAFGKTSAAMNRFALQHTDWKTYAPHQSGAPHRAWGAGIKIDGYPSIHLLNAESAARHFIGEYRDVLLADTARLRLLYMRTVNEKVYFRFVQQYHGLDVLFNYVDIRMTTQGSVVMFGSDYQPDISLNTIPAISLDASKEYAKLGLERRPSNDNIENRKLVVLPIKSAGTTSYRLAYNLVVHVSIDEVWDTFVDAHTGDILWRRNLVLHGHDDDCVQMQPATNIATGQIFVKVFKSDPRQSEEFVALPFATINFQGTNVTTDANGRFSIDLGSNTSATGVARLSGPYAMAVRNDRTNPNEETLMAVPVTVSQESTHYWDESNSESSERNGYYHTAVVSRWIRGFDSSDFLKDTDYPMPVNVNYSQQSCNANWNGTAINFYKESSSCRNTATLPSVIYHEYGHAINTFLYNALMGMRTFNRAMEEGNADITAALLLDDPRIGLGMYKGSGEGLLRNCDNTFRYPDDFNGQIHSDGRILAGAVWDTRKRIGLDVTARLAHAVKYGTPDNLNYGIALTDYFIEMLVADDDNGNLSDGTPHSEHIIEAFGIHGIPASGITITHTEIANIQSSIGPYVFEGTALAGSEIAQDRIFISSVKLIFSDDNWLSNSTIALNYDESTGRFQGTMPSMNDGSIVRYYFEATDNFGSSVRYPTPAPSAAFAFVVGYTTKIYTDMSTDKGWSVTGDAMAGVWVRAKPVGTFYATYVGPPYIPWVQPDEDHTLGADSLCWVTGNTEPDEEIEFLMSRQDVDDGATILTTTLYPTAGLLSPILRYYRWYSNNAGSSPGEDEWVVQLSADTGNTWLDLERTNESIANWTPRIFRLKSYISDETEAVMLRFIAEDKAPGSLVEAAIDDFEILDFHESVFVEQIPMPRGLELYQNYPNPFNPSTDIRFTLPAALHISVKVYDMFGKVVATLVEGIMDAGTASVRFEAAHLPSGVYVYRLTTSAGSLSRQMILAK